MKNFLGFILSSFALALVLWAGASGIEEFNWSIETSQTIDFLLFIGAIGAAAYFVLFTINKISSDKTGFAFMGLVLLKMAFSIYYLYPFISASPDNIVNLTIYFFVIYFCFLLLEVWFLARLIKSTLAEKDALKNN